MKENQNDQKSTLQKDNQQNQGSQLNRNDTRKSDDPFNKPSSKIEETVDEEDERTMVEKEHRDTEHQHDYKVPVSTPGSKDKIQEPQQRRNPETDLNKDKIANQENARSSSQNEKK